MKYWKERYYQNRLEGYRPLGAAFISAPEWLQMAIVFVAIVLVGIRLMDRFWP